MNVDKMKYYEAHVFHSCTDGFSVFFKSDSIEEIQDDIITEAVKQNKLDADDANYVDYTQELSESEYNDAVGIRN